MGRRLFASAAIGLVVFGLLWYTVFTAVTAALVAAGVTGVVVIGGSTLDAVDIVLDMLASIVLGVFAAIAAVFAAILSIFN